MEIFWTQTAEKNLDYIQEYIAADNPSAALQTVLDIIRAVSLLQDHPAMGRVGRVFNTRELIISKTPYIVPYRVHHHRIEILRVLHSSMRWPDYL